MFVYEFLRLMMRLVVLHAGRELQQVEASPVGIVGGPLVSAAPAQANYIIYHQILYSGATIQGSAEGWQNLFAIMRFCYIEVLFHVFYYYWGKQNRSLYRELRHIDVPCI